MKKRLVYFGLVALLMIAFVGILCYADDDQASNLIPATTVETPTENEAQPAENDSLSAENTTVEATKESVKITPEEATACALKNVAGEIINVTLENYNGNEAYRVTIKTATGSTDVMIDAVNAKVLALENKSE
jgi:uncharacterized membrane protein YkoI